MSSIKRLLVAVFSVVGIDDLYFWGGMALLWTALYPLHASLAKGVCGIVLISVGLYSATRGG